MVSVVFHDMIVRLRLWFGSEQRHVLIVLSTTLNPRLIIDILVACTYQFNMSDQMTNNKT